MALFNFKSLFLPPPAIGPVQNCPGSRQPVDVAELFLYNNPDILNIESALVLFPRWESFRNRNLAFFSNNSDPLNQLTFQAILTSLALPIFRSTPQSIGPLLSTQPLDSDNGYEMLDGVLWERDELGLVWHITPDFLAQYVPLPRFFGGEG